MSKLKQALTVDRITVRHGRLSLIVHIASGFPHTTDKILADRLLAVRPLLANHTCINARGSTFGAIIDKTSLPHVLEHVIIDEQVNDRRSSADITFVGTTEWLDEADGQARIEVNFADDLVALHALQCALDFLNTMVAGSNMGTNSE